MIARNPMLEMQPIELGELRMARLQGAVTEDWATASGQLGPGNACFVASLGISYHSLIDAMRPQAPHPSLLMADIGWRMAPAVKRLSYPYHARTIAGQRPFRWLS